MTDQPKTWGEMTDAEKGALLLAEHEGRVIEHNGACGWHKVINPIWLDGSAYRIRPEPKRETVKLFWGCGDGIQAHCYKCPYDTHRITFDTIDGKPDCNSIRMEEIE